MGDGTPPPPRAFTGSAQFQVTNTINRMANEQRHMITRDVKVHELGQLFVDPHKLEALTRAFHDVEFTTINQGLTIEAPVGSPVDKDGDPVSMLYCWDWASAPDGFFVPKHNKPLKMRDDAPPELIEKYTEIHMRLANVAYDFGLVHHVFNGLNVNGFCNTPPQMRFVWPAIRHIVARFDTKLEETLIDASSRAGDKARVPPHLADHMVETMNTIARTTLLEKVNLNERREFSLVPQAAWFTASQNMNFEACK